MAGFSPAAARQFIVGERFAALIGWHAILSGADATFHATSAKTHWSQYKRP